jgi:hypothetical protein
MTEFRVLDALLIAETKVMKLARSKIPEFLLAEAEMNASEGPVTEPYFLTA